MKLAFCLFKYFPYGGLQRDFLRIAKACYARGHEILVYTMHWEGAFEPGLNVNILPVSGKQNHTRVRAFVDKLSSMLLKNPPDVVVGFNKMPNLDLYYAADVCYKARIHETRSFLYRLLPRYFEWLALEKEVFSYGKKTEILLISPREQAIFMDYYQTEKERFHLLPPGIAKDRIAKGDSEFIREEIRTRYQIKPDEFILLMVGSGFKTKGVDRSIHALASLPDHLKKRAHLWVIGADHPGIFERLAHRLQVEKQVQFLGGREDVPHFLFAADLLLHPAYHENTGTVLLESLAAGLPVLTVDRCGYAAYVADAKGGLVLPSPFNQSQLNIALEKMLSSNERKNWQANAVMFAKTTDIYSLPEKAVNIIENFRKKSDLLFT